MLLMSRGPLLKGKRDDSTKTGSDDESRTVRDRYDGHFDRSQSQCLTAGRSGNGE